ncbi:manganese/zinc/iron transport system substrate-binding protein [Halospina denitrificans]|uniref:Manganese/zinc/iron transport system substrate-binding protein n=1 Tax=Halospina denitrificans TaxID=332522 RepID=A0A4R7JYH8_9GAMM|nr:zinc ABC transporter substrate-binding protein [Halospina denitrificans]TDT43126.1 manganese/zinc/iron transport system substrate-binding protein [Halospina denitrificans]
MKARYLLLLSLLTLTACGADTADERPKVVTTIAMISDVARNVAGDCVQVTPLMGPGVDPHLYEARASDIKRLRDADAILYAGFSLEGQMANVLEKLGSRKPSLAVGPASFDESDLISHEDYAIDPHLWMDVGRWLQIVPSVTEQLVDIAPECEQAMRQRAEQYREELAALDGWIQESIASIPERQRILITAHDAFGYYGLAYDIDVKGIQGISTDSEAAIADIRDMVTTVVERNVPAVFIESTINPRTIESVIDGAGERGHSVRIGGELFSDAMGEEGTAGGTYIGMLRSNTVEIVEGLGGETASWPATLDGWKQRWEP